MKTQSLAFRVSCLTLFFFLSPVVSAVAHQHTNLLNDVVTISISKTEQSLGLRSSSRNDVLYVGGNGTGNYSTIQEAIDAASPGDTIFVYHHSSPYYENIIVDKSLTLTGEKEMMHVIDGSGLGDVVTISDDAHSTMMTYFVIQKSDTNGVFIGFNLSGVTISNTLIQDCYFGVHCWHATAVVITNNTIRNNRWGVLFELTDHSVLSYNLIENNSEYGCVIDSSPANRVFSNEFRNNRVGLVPVRSLHNDIYRNNFINNIKASAVWKNSISKWHENYWDDSNQHLLKRVHIITGIFRSEILNKQFFWIQLDTRATGTPWTLPIMEENSYES